MYPRALLLLILLGLAQPSISATVNVRVEIRDSLLELNGGTSINYAVYTAKGSFQKNSDLFIWNTDDDIILKVVNLTSVDHGLEIENHLIIPSIFPGDSATQTFSLTTPGVFRYFDPLNVPFNRYYGLGGTIHVKDVIDNTPYFYWDIREHQEDWNIMISGGGTPSLPNYSPNHFTINGNHSPNINQDTLARVTGNVGLQFKIIIVNQGLSIHSLHFHGYHLTIDADSKKNLNIGRSKDTFGVYPGEYLVLNCTPDKPGEYPVHDHNLVAVSGGQEYGKGMFTTLLIGP